MNRKERDEAVKRVSDREQLEAHSVRLRLTQRISELRKQVNITRWQYAAGKVSMGVYEDVYETCKAAERELAELDAINAKREELEARIQLARARQATHTLKSDARTRTMWHNREVKAAEELAELDAPVYDRECKGDGSHSTITRTELAAKLDGYYKPDSIPGLIAQLDAGELDAPEIHACAICGKTKGNGMTIFKAANGKKWYCYEHSYRRRLAINVKSVAQRGDESVSYPDNIADAPEVK
jgi:hypothetical protein